MKFKREYFCCSPKLLRNIDEIHEVEAAITDVAWKDHFSIEAEGHTYEHQSGYNRALAAQLLKRGWTMQPKLCTKPSLIGNASKSDIFVEVQFGNSATLYRDYYKFHYGLMHGLLSLAVLIVPTTPTAFFPTRLAASPTWLSTISPAAATRFCRSRFRYWSSGYCPRINHGPPQGRP